MFAETDHHAGHADILRELIDGTVGRYSVIDNMDPSGGDSSHRDSAWWQGYRARIEEAAKDADTGPG